MKTTSSKRSFLFILAALLCLSGGGLAFIQQGFSILTGSLLAAGGVCLAIILTAMLCTASLKVTAANMRLGVAILGAVCILVLVNVVALQFDRRFDVTTFKQHTISPASRRVLPQVTSPVKITVFYPGLAPSYLEDMLSEYKRLSNGSIEYTIVDPLTRIAYAAQFGQVIRSDEHRVIVESGPVRKDIEFNDAPLSEEQLTNAIINVTRPAKTACFLKGHGEADPADTSQTGLSLLGNTLQGNRFTLTYLLLTNAGSIPETCDLLVIAGPKTPFRPEEDEIIRDYLDKGGRALILLESTPMGTEDNPLNESDKAKNPRLNNILNEWGITVNNDLAVDLANYVGQDVGCPATRNYPEHKAITTNLDYTFFIRPRSLTLDAESSRTPFVAPLVLTASEKTSWAETNTRLQVKFDPQEDTPGPIPLGAVVYEPKTDSKQQETRLIVITDTDFATNQFIGQYSNADLILNAVQWLTDVDFIAIPQGVRTSFDSIVLTERQKRITLVTIWAVPLLILSGGWLAWRLRQSE